MKNMKIKNLLKCSALLLLLGGSAQAQEFGSISLADIQAVELPEFKAPKPAVKPQAAEEDETIGVDMSIRVPFKTIKKNLLKIAEAEPRIELIDPAAPLVSKNGEAMMINNLRINVNGIIAEPVLLLKPYLEGKDRIAVKIEKVKFHVLMMPDKSVKAAQPQFQIEDVMQQVMDIMIKGINDALDKKFQEDGLPFKAKDILTMNYDKKAWILHTKISTEILKNYVPPALVGPMHVTGFSYDEQAVYVKVKTDR